jgi:hypothetical protein
VTGRRPDAGPATGATPDEIRALTVVATIVDGEIAYCAAAEICDGP